MGSTLRSTISANDFGWRVLIPVQFALSIWTAQFLCMLKRPQFPAAGFSPLFIALAVLGIFTVALDLLVERVLPPSGCLAKN